jgi:hypothetical protein
MQAAVKLSWKGWFPMPREQIALINQNLGATARGSTARVVFEALCDLANTRNMQIFEAPIALVAHVAGVAYKTAAARLRDLERIGVLSIESPAHGGLDVAHRYTLRTASLTERSVSLAERSVNPTPDALPTSMKKENTTTQPPDAVFLPFIARFRAVRPEFAKSRDFDVAEAIRACPAGPARDQAFTEFERDAATALQCPPNPVRMLRGYMAQGAEGPKKKRKVSTHDNRGEYPENERPLPSL